MSTQHHIKFILLVLVASGVWGVIEIINNSTPNAIVTPQSSTQPTTQPSINTQAAAHSRPDNTSPISAFKQAQTLLSQGQVQNALVLIHAHQVSLSSEQLNALKQSFFNYLAPLQQTQLAESKLNAFVSYFDELDVWEQLVQVRLLNDDHAAAFAALKRAAELEIDPSEQQIKLSHLQRLAAQLKNDLTANQDFVGIMRLYQELYNQYSNTPLFAYELALAHLQLNNTSSAKQLLQPLRFDQEFGQLAQQQLAAIAQPNNPTKPDSAVTNKQDLIVPLTRQGNSFLLNTAINGNTVPMLLDTGASITALSAQQIQHLRLPALGQTITLRTANGLRTAPLYQVDTLQLGQLTINNLTVAEIDFGDDTQVQGLLGTDTLNAIDQRYDYLIDNQANALIFRLK